jgi:hypothetical protein
VGVGEYACTQSIDFLELAENCTFLDRKLIGALHETANEHWLTITRHYCIEKFLTRRFSMSMPKDEIQTEMVSAWKTYVEALEKSLDMLDKDITEAHDMASVCTSEWCEATEHVIDELSNALFSISEPRWSSPEDSKKIKRLKRRVYDLYVNYRGVYEKVA